MRWTALVSSTTWLTATRLLGTGVSLLVTILVTKTMGVVELGYIIQIVSLVSLFYLPLDFGINPIALRLASNHPVASLQQTALQFRYRLAVILMGLVMTLLLVFSLISVHYQHPTVVVGVLLLSVTILIQAVVKTSQIYWHQRQNFWIQGWYEVVNALVTLVFVGLVLVTSISLWLILGYVVGQLLSGLISVGLQPKSWLRGTKPLLPFVTFLEALPLAGAQIASTLTSKLDIWFISLWLGPLATGVYGIPKRIVEVLLLIPFFTGSVLFAAFVKELPPKATMIKVLSMAVLLGIACLGLVHVSAPLLVLISSELVESITTLRWFSWLLPLYFVTAPLMWLLTAWGEQKWLLVVYGVGLVITLVSISITLPTMGILGAVVANGLGELVVLALLLLRVTVKYRHESQPNLIY